MKSDSPGRDGFAMAMVVFFLFAIGVAGAAGYQLVSLEWDLSTQGKEGDLAFAVADAGLERYVGEHIGRPVDSVTYAIGAGTATIRVRKLLEVDSATDLYLLRSVGEVTDARWSDSPARRTVGQHALLHRAPVGIHAALLTTVGNVRVRAGGRIDGEDDASSSDCSAGGLYDLPGIMNTGTYSDQGGGDVDGSPDHVRIQPAAAVIDSARVRWDVLESSSFPVPHDGSPPDWAGVAADSFPVVRATADLSAGSAWAGQGVLIVPGALSIQSGFEWKGIILAGEVSNLGSGGGSPRIDGIVVGGLDGQGGSFEMRGTRLRYDSCHALAANASLAYFEPVPGTWHDGL